MSLKTPSNQLPNSDAFTVLSEQAISEPMSILSLVVVPPEFKTPMVKYTSGCLKFGYKVLNSLKRNSISLELEFNSNV